MVSMSETTTTTWRNPLLSLRAPEWVLAMYAFLGHFVWEMLQTPFFTDMPNMAHWPATLMCLKATIGDVAIAVAAFAAVALGNSDRGWFLERRARTLLPFLVLGFAATIALELHAVHWAGRWSYAPLMPVLPLLGTGVVPLVQWLVVPLLSLFLMQRHHLGIPLSARAHAACQ